MWERKLPIPLLLGTHLSGSKVGWHQTKIVEDYFGLKSDDLWWTWKSTRCPKKKVWITTCNRSSNSHFFLGHLVVLKKVSSVEQSWWLFSWFFEHSGETNPCPQLEALDRSPSSRPVHLLEHDVSSLNLSLKTVHDTKDTTCTMLHNFVSVLQHFDNFGNFGSFLAWSRSF